MGFNLLLFIIYFDVQIVPDMASENPSKVSFVSFWQIPIVLSGSFILELDLTGSYTCPAPTPGIIHKSGSSGSS